MAWSWSALAGRWHGRSTPLAGRGRVLRVALRHAGPRAFQTANESPSVPQAMAAEVNASRSIVRSREQGPLVMELRLVPSSKAGARRVRRAALAEQPLLAVPGPSRRPVDREPPFGLTSGWNTPSAVLMAAGRSARRRARRHRSSPGQEVARGAPAAVLTHSSRAVAVAAVDPARGVGVAGVGELPGLVRSPRRRPRRRCRHRRDRRACKPGLADRATTPCARGTGDRRPSSCPARRVADVDRRNRRARLRRLRIGRAVSARDLELVHARQACCAITASQSRRTTARRRSAARPGVRRLDPFTRRSSRVHHLEARPRPCRSGDVQVRLWGGGVVGPEGRRSRRWGRSGPEGRRRREPGVSAPSTGAVVGAGTSVVGAAESTGRGQGRLARPADRGVPLSTTRAERAGDGGQASADGR